MERNKFTTRQAAKLVGVSRQTLQMWIREKLINAPPVVNVANMSVRLWGAAEIKEAKQFKGKLWRGPIPKESRRITKRRASV